AAGRARQLAAPRPPRRDAPFLRPRGILPAALGAARLAAPRHPPHRRRGDAPSPPLGPPPPPDRGRARLPRRRRARDAPPLRVPRREPRRRGVALSRAAPARIRRGRLAPAGDGPRARAPRP